MTGVKNARVWPHGMFARVLRYGVSMLVVAAVALAGLAGFAIRSVENDTRGLVAWLGTRACSAHSSIELADFPAPVTVYSAEGTVVATSVQPPVVFESPSWTYPLRGRVQRVACKGASSQGRDPASYAVLQRLQPSFGLLQLALAFAGVLFVVVFASIPLARSITAPIEEIAEITRRFGSGDLRSRTNVQTKDELGDLGRAFNLMADRIGILLRQEKELLANVSHELRTPLARIRVVLEDAQEAPGRSVSALLEIERDLSDLERLVDDLLDAMRPEPGLGATAHAAFVLRLETVSLTSLFQTAIDRFRRSFPERSVTIDLLDSLQVQGDSALLLRVLDNLLENARRYSDASSEICLRARSRQANVHIEVEDHGIGIEPSDIPQVFTPFFRGDRSRTRATGGVGLGLSICQKIVLAHGGTLSLQSVVNAGTTVTIGLPARSAACDENVLG
jgi:signal transduction histidine kinase